MRVYKLDLLYYLPRLKQQNRHDGNDLAIFRPARKIWKILKLRRNISPLRGRNNVYLVKDLNLRRYGNLPDARIGLWEMQRRRWMRGMLIPRANVSKMISRVLKVRRLGCRLVHARKVK